MKPKHDSKEDKTTDNDHQKTVSGKNQRGPADKIGKNAGGAYGSRGQNRRSAGSAKGTPSVGSHKPEGDGPGTKKFKHNRRQNGEAGQTKDQHETTRFTPPVKFAKPVDAGPMLSPACAALDVVAL